MPGNCCRQAFSNCGARRGPQSHNCWAAFRLAKWAPGPSWSPSSRHVAEEDQQRDGRGIVRSRTLARAARTVPATGRPIRSAGGRECSNAAKMSEAMPRIVEAQACCHAGVPRRAARPQRGRDGTTPPWRTASRPTALVSALATLERDRDMGRRRSRLPMGRPGPIRNMRVAPGPKRHKTWKPGPRGTQRSGRHVSARSPIHAPGRADWARHRRKGLARSSGPGAAGQPTRQELSRQNALSSALRKPQKAESPHRIFGTLIRPPSFSLNYMRLPGFGNSKDRSTSQVTIHVH